MKELGNYYLTEIRSPLILEKKSKLLSEPTPKGIILSGSILLSLG